MNIEWGRSQEERPASSFAARDSDVLQPEQFRDRATPSGDQDLMESESSLLVRRKALPGRRIPSHGRHVAIPEPLQQPQVLVNTTKCGRPRLSDLSLIFCAQLGIACVESGAYQEDVTVPQLQWLRGLLLLPPEAGHEVVVSDPVRPRGVVLLPVGHCI